ncbi:MAG TPA: ABC transporter permease subunit [Rugosimonospora sp.]|nr:ABC transporter permease subunit [Rugosimonospora sp.]
MTAAPYRSTEPVGRDGFTRLARGEWTKFRTVRAWLVATGVAAVLVVGIGILQGLGSHSTIDSTPDNPNGTAGHPYVPTGPDGEAVSDDFYFLHRPLAANGSLTTRVGTLSGGLISPHGGVPAGSGGPPVTGSVEPWAKAGLIIKTSTSQGTAYAAIMVTGGHGVRMQYNYTRDIAGPASASWLRLTRAGDTITGYASTDGSIWTRVASVRLTGLPASAPAGMFVASPGHSTFDQHLGGGTGQGVLTSATATFGAVDLRGGPAGSAWTGTGVGDQAPAAAGGYRQSGGGYTVTGSGDIAPDVGSSGATVERNLAGMFGALTVMVVLAVLFITTEYRRGLIRTSLTTSPRRGRVLAAKALTIGAVTFVTGLVAAALAIPLGEHFLRRNGNYIYPVSALTEVRVVAGTAALLAVASVLALAVGTVLRRSAAAVAAVIVLVVLPYLLATAGVLPPGPADWLLRVTPAAAFAVQQSLPAYPQVQHAYTPLLGFYPLAPWAGFAVLCGWTAVALVAAGYLLHRRDA